MQYTDNRPLFPPALWVEMSGEVQAGDTGKFLESITPYVGRDIYEIVIRIDSPGGSLVESLRFGRAISDLPYLTRAYVGVEGGEEICASACVNVYLGADYRFLSESARIGVHRFSMSSNAIDADEAISLSQDLSAQIVEHIRAMRADPAFFQIMVSAHAQDIYWVPRETLEALHVVTNGIYSETAEYRNVNGSIALYLEQVGQVGTNALTLICGQRGLIGIFDLNEPEVAALEHLEVYIDGMTFPIANYEIVDRSNYRFKAISLLPGNIVDRLASARELGARMVSPTAGIFFGFEDGVVDSKIAETARGCPSSTLPNEVMTSAIGVDILGGDLTPDGYRGVTYEQCQSICLADDRCVAVSYVSQKSWCWPKASIPATASNPNILSAVRE